MRRVIVDYYAGTTVISRTRSVRDREYLVVAFTRDIERIGFGIVREAGRTCDNRRRIRSRGVSRCDLYGSADFHHAFVIEADFVAHDGPLKRSRATRLRRQAISDEVLDVAVLLHIDGRTPWPIDAGVGPVAHRDHAYLGTFSIEDQNRTTVNGGRGSIGGRNRSRKNESMRDDI